MSNSKKRKQPAPDVSGQPAFVIRGKRYPIVQMDTGNLWDVIAVKEQTGLNVNTLERCLTDMMEVGQPGARFQSAEDVFDSPDHLRSIGVQMWLARQAAGEDLTIREASSIPFGEWEIDQPTEVADSDEPDPTDGGEQSADSN